MLKLFYLWLMEFLQIGPLDILIFSLYSDVTPLIPDTEDLSFFKNQSRQRFLSFTDFLKQLLVLLIFLYFFSILSISVLIFISFFKILISFFLGFFFFMWKLRS